MQIIYVIIYINDLLKEMNDDSVVSIGYTDDACFLIDFPSQMDGGVLERMLMRVRSWTNSNGLLLNPSKCCFMILGNRSYRLRTEVRMHSEYGHNNECE